MLTRAWIWLTDDHVLWTSPEVHRHFLRCDGCGRIFRHYWGCKEPHERGRIGCRCGGAKARIVHIPEWRAAWLVLSCYAWRKLILRKRYWDPRFPTRDEHVEA
jgi:hypothetical protein